MDWYTHNKLAAEEPWNWNRFGRGLIHSIGVGSAIMVLMVYFNMDRRRAEDMVNNYPQIAEQELSKVPSQIVQQIVAQGQSAPVAQQPQTAPAPAQAVQTPAAISAGELIPQIKRHEGSEHIAYKDSTGHPTVGVGFNLDRPDAKSLITQVGANYDQVRAGQQALNDSQIDQLLNITVNEAMGLANSFIPNLASHPKKIQLVIADMCFNLGPKINQFTNLKQHITMRDYASAAIDMQHSTWNGQVGQRAKNLVQMMNSASIESQSRP